MSQQRLLATPRPRKGKGKQNFSSCYLSYSHPDPKGPSPSGKGQTEVPLPWGVGVAKSPPWQNSTQKCPRRLGSCRVGSTAHALPWPGPGTPSVCSEGCLVASKGSPLTEQGTIETRLGQVVTLGVMPVACPAWAGLGPISATICPPPPPAGCRHRLGSV